MIHVDVVIAIVTDEANQVLLSRRQAHQHQAGKWEFPGGKIAPGETPHQALARELQEELGITPLLSQPVITIEHSYPDRHVSLNVQQIDRYTGTIEAMEGQEICWYPRNALSDLEFPAANTAVLTALKLPHHYLITPEPGDDWRRFLNQLDAALSFDVKLVQFRAPALPGSDYLKLARRVAERCRGSGAKLLINADPSWVSQAGADGVHLTSRRLMASGQRPLGDELMVATSCHTAGELIQSENIRADFAVLSPVAVTPSHPKLRPLGWEVFQSLCRRANLPVFALGGMRRQDLAKARQKGAQGIAAIRGLLEGP